MKQKILALSLSASLLFTLASCGNQNGGESSSPSPSQSETPSASQSEPAVSEPEASEPAQGGGVDLQAFYESLLVTDPESADYFNPDTPVSDESYPGLAEIATKQKVIYQPMMGAVACEIALVEVENAADVDAVKAIFQARIDAYLHSANTKIMLSYMITFVNE